MDRKRRIHELLNEASNEMLEFIRESECGFDDRWVPAVYIRNQLDLNIAPYQRKGDRYGHKGCFFAVLARVLEDNNLVEYQERNNLVFYRSRQKE